MININYLKAYQKSSNKKFIRINKKETLDIEKFKKRLLQLGLISTIVISVYATNQEEIKAAGNEVKGALNYFSFQFGGKTDLLVDTAATMTEHGYPNYLKDGEWSKNYQRLDQLDNFQLYTYMGRDAALNVLNYRGFSSWDEYAKSEGYNSEEEWSYNQSIDYMQNKGKSRGK